MLQGAVDHPVAHDVFEQGAWPDPDLLYSYTPVGGSPPPKCGGPGVLEYCTGSFCDPVPRHSRTQAALWCGQSLLASGTIIPQDLWSLWLPHRGCLHSDVFNKHGLVGHGGPALIIAGVARSAGR